VGEPKLPHEANCLRGEVEHGLQLLRRIHTPWKGRNSALDTMVSIANGRPRAIVVIATRYGHNELQIARVRL
jgi:hypothetical protein